MKLVIGSLFVLVMMFSFAVAGTSASVRTDFYIPEATAVGADVVDDSGSSNGFLEEFVYLSSIVIVFAVILRLFQKLWGGKLKTKKTKAKVRTKGRRRNK